MKIDREPVSNTFTPLYTVENSLNQGLPVATILAQAKSDNTNVDDLIRTFSYHQYFVQHYQLPYDPSQKIILVRISIAPIPQELLKRHKMLSRELLNLFDHHFISDLDERITNLPTYRTMQRLPATEMLFNLEDNISF